MYFIHFTTCLDPRPFSCNNPRAIGLLTPALFAFRALFAFVCAFCRFRPSFIPYQKGQRRILFLCFSKVYFQYFVLQGRENTDSSPGNWNKGPLPSVLDGLLMNILAGWNALLLAQTVEYQWQELLSQEIPTPQIRLREMMGNGYIHGYIMIIW